MKTQFSFFTLQNSRILLALGLLFAAVCPAIAGDESYADKLTHARLFAGQRLVWVGQTTPSEAESKELWDAFGVGRNKTFDDAVNGLETFINAHPNSPWVPSLRANMGVYYKDNGYFTHALDDWQAAWDATCQMHDVNGVKVADYTLVNWLHLLSSLGRTEKMKELLDQTKDRRILGQYQTWYHQEKVAYETMILDPKISYRCGTFALYTVAQVLTGTNYVRQIWEQPSPETGFSMAALMMFAESNHLNMAAVEREGGDQLVVPSVVHWKQNHYAAIVAQKGDLYKVVDPTFRMSRWISANAINSECSGQFLVSAAAVPEGWRTLTPTETSQIFGKGFISYMDPPPCGAGDAGGGGGGPGGGGGGPGGGGGGPGGGMGGGGGGFGFGGRSGGGGSGGGGAGGSGVSCPRICGPGSQGNGNGNSNNNTNSSCGCSGMPNWTVMEPWCDVWLTDEPVAYQPSKGPPISFKLIYWAEGGAYDNWEQDLDLNGYMGNFGFNWTCSWFSYMRPNDPVGDDFTLYAGDGGMRIYTNFDGTSPEFGKRTRCLTDTNSAGTIVGYTILYPSGAEDV